jgi:hypothetical protein
MDHSANMGYRRSKWIFQANYEHYVNVGYRPNRVKKFLSNLSFLQLFLFSMCFSFLSCLFLYYFLARQGFQNLKAEHWNWQQNLLNSMTKEPSFAHLLLPDWRLRIWKDWILAGLVSVSNPYEKVGTEISAYHIPT